MNTQTFSLTILFSYMFLNFVNKLLMGVLYYGWFKDIFFFCKAGANLNSRNIW